MFSPSMFGSLWFASGLRTPGTLAPETYTGLMLTALGLPFLGSILLSNDIR
jgi:hypothetical protein